MTMGQNRETKDEKKKQKKQKMELLKNKPKPASKSRGQRALVDCRPLQGLVHLHIVQSLLSLPSAPPRRLCLCRCAAVYMGQG